MPTLDDDLPTPPPSAADLRDDDLYAELAALNADQTMSAVVDYSDAQIARLLGRVNRGKEAGPNGPKVKVARYDNPNDLVRRPDDIDMTRLAHLAGQRVVTVDLDGTIYGRSECCPVPRNHPDAFAATDTCDHIRQDTVDEIRQLCEQTGATPVILSWRGGAVPESAEWLDHIGFDRGAMLIPGSDDDCAGHEMPWLASGHMDHQANRKAHGGSQAAFKYATVKVLQERLGCEVVGSFDDNPKVVAALSSLGVGKVVHVTSDTTGPTCGSCSQPFDVNTRESKRQPGICTECAWPAPDAGVDGITRPDWMPTPVPPGDPLGQVTRPAWMPDQAGRGRRLGPSGPS